MENVEADRNGAFVSSNSLQSKFKIKTEVVGHHQERENCQDRKRKTEFNGGVS